MLVVTIALIVIILYSIQFSELGQEQQGATSVLQKANNSTSNFNDSTNETSIINFNDTLSPTAVKNTSVNAPVMPRYPFESHGYLQYHIQGGWGNQIRCIEHSYYFARAVNRTLVLTPVAPHIFFRFRDVYSADKGFHLDYSLEQHYLKRLPEYRYLRLDRVLDVEVAFPGIETIDFRDYHERVNPNITKQETWVVESKFGHLNTKWMMDAPNLADRYETKVVQERKHTVSYNQSYRDIRHDLPPLTASKPLWTLLDSFLAQLEHSSVSYAPKFRPRYSAWIRNISQQIHLEDFQSLPYAAIHIRGSDGQFQKTEAIHKTVASTLDSIQSHIEEWLLSTEASGKVSQNISLGLFVATDVPKLRQSNFFNSRLEELTRSFQDTHNVTVSLTTWYSFELIERVKELLPHPNFLGEEPTIFMDQQLAACAEIGFVGTPRSTFSSLIHALRKDRQVACS